MFIPCGQLLVGTSQPDLVVPVDEPLWSIIESEEKCCAGLNTICLQLLAQALGCLEDAALGGKSAKALDIC